MEARIIRPLRLHTALALAALAALPGFGAGAVVTEGAALEIDGTAGRLQDTDQCGRPVGRYSMDGRDQET